MKVFSKEELARCNGKNHDPACVTYRGKAYDVSASSLRKDGKHQVLHDSGVDLTDVMTKDRLATC